ncbi:hypothetical protein LCGC14_2407700 [marine sediment metagenome]|uniref:Uncharacterized protein n=1 Tax=marine sediment metagenome TaxID=412755 RepID=A0A0F9EMY2_9ZZZZ
MAQFRATIRGNREEASRLGTKKSGIEAHINGWFVGVAIYAAHDVSNNQDRFSIYITSGSDSGKESFIGEVREGPDGPVFIPDYTKKGG